VPIGHEAAPETSRQPGTIERTAAQSNRIRAVITFPRPLRRVEIASVA
jgi:hypothetical protein